MRRYWDTRYRDTLIFRCIVTPLLSKSPKVTFSETKAFTEAANEQQCE